MIQFCAVIMTTKPYTSDERSGHFPTMVWRQVSQKRDLFLFPGFFLTAEPKYGYKTRSTALLPHNTEKCAYRKVAIYQ